MKRSVAIRMAAAMVCLASVAFAAERPRVTLITQEKGYVHPVAERREDRPSLVEATIAGIGEEAGLDVEAVRDVRLLTREALKSVKVVVFFVNGEVPFEGDQIARLEGWVKQGGSVLFLHPATDAIRSNPVWRNLVGGTYGGQPWGETDAVTFKVVDPGFPACRMFGETFALTDAVSLQNSVDRNSVHELIAVDMEGTEKKRPVHVPVAWCREYEKGKVLTTTLGHSEGTWRNPAFRGHLLGAMKWLLGVEKAEVKPNPQVAAREDEIIKRLNVAAPPGLPQVGEGLKLSVFAEAPQFHSPSSMCVSAEGRVFVGEDEYNTGNDRKMGNSRVKLLVDTNGDGKADKVTVFADKVCAPQGMTFVGDTLYVVNAPYLTAFRDTNGDGVADERRNLITGFGPVPEGLVHHIPSGVHMGIDGFLYVTVGDKGIVKATGTDGRVISLMGGGIVRVRPDGSEMEVFCRGNRNPYSAAPDPFMDVFMRDNTNDGGGWNSRLSQMQRGAQYGYPTLFTNFGDEVVPCIADYGGGGATGSVYVKEPWLPRPYGDSLYTIDWGRSWVYRHHLAERGATFKPDQEEFVFGSFPTSIDVDGRGRLYVSNWGRLSWGEAPPIGSVYVIEGRENGAPPVPVMGKLSDEVLVGQLASASAVVRREAQGEILKRGRLATSVLAIARGDYPLDVRVAALFTYAQLEGRGAMGELAALSREPRLREFAVRAMGDRPKWIGYANAEMFAAYVSDGNPRVRVQAAIALGKSGRADLALYLVPRTADGDVMARHAAQQSLRELNAVEACLAGLEGASPEVTAGVLRTLRDMHDRRVVVAVGRFIAGASAGLKKEAVKTLERLYTVEAPWDGTWWLTRPDTAGPNYKPARWAGSEEVGKLFVALIEDKDQEVAKAAIAGAGHVRAVETAGTLAALVSAGGPLKVDATRALIGLRSASPESLGAMEAVITGAGWEEGLVNQAIDVLGSLEQPAAQGTLVRVVGRLDREEKVRQGVIDKAAGVLGNRAAMGEMVGKVSGLLGAKNRAARVAACTALARSMDADAKARVAEIWKTDDAGQVEALLAAIQALPPEGAKGYVERVKGLLKDSRQAVRHGAIAARGKIADGEVAGDLLAAAKPVKDRAVAVRVLADIEPAKVTPEQIVAVTGLVAETAASMANSPDKETYGKLMGAAQKYLADTRVPREKAAAWVKELKHSGVIAEYVRTEPIPTEAGKAFSAVLPADQKPAGPFGTFAVGGKPYEWKPVVVTDPSGVLGLAMPANTVTFLRASVSSAGGGAAVLTAGSDDGLQVYLNGKKVISSDANRPTKADQDRALVQLVPGTNTLLVRVNNNAGDAGVEVRVRQRVTDFEPAELEGVPKDLPGDVKRGQALFNSLGCVRCHAIDPHQEPKGPYLGDAGTKYQVPHLIESILRPSAKIAQGFTTVKVTTKSGEQVGWVTKEGADEITLRDAAGQSMAIRKAEITGRQPVAQSMMPEGLMSGSTLDDFSALLAYLGTLNAKP